MVSQVEDHIGVNGTEVQRAILLGAETGRLRFGAPAARPGSTRKPSARHNVCKQELRCSAPMLADIAIRKFEATAP